MHQWCASLGTEHFISRMSGQLLFWMIQLLQGRNIIITMVGRYCNYFITKGFFAYENEIHSGTRNVFIVETQTTKKGP